MLGLLVPVEKSQQAFTSLNTKVLDEFGADFMQTNSVCVDQVHNTSILMVSAERLCLFYNSFHYWPVVLYAVVILGS